MPPNLLIHGFSLEPLSSKSTYKGIANPQELYMVNDDASTLQHLQLRVYKDKLLYNYLYIQAYPYLLSIDTF